MKRFERILTIALLGAGLVACESMKLGDAGLSKAPETSGTYNIDHLVDREVLESQLSRSNVLGHIHTGSVAS